MNIPQEGFENKSSRIHENVKKKKKQRYHDTHMAIVKKKKKNQRHSVSICLFLEMEKTGILAYFGKPFGGFLKS